MSVRAKMRVVRRSEVDWATFVRVVVLQAVYGDGTENKSWSEATPSGQIELTITNPAAHEQFKLGKEYFVDFTPAGE